MAGQDGPISKVSERPPPAPLPLSAAPETACKICAAVSPLFDVVDFHKICKERQGRSLHLSGRPVYYYRCPQCGFLFTRSFDQWQPEDFAKFIYNRDYPALDPDYAEARPRENAAHIQQLFGDRLRGLQLLDFGGGNGRFAAQLREAGCQAESFDPFATAVSSSMSGTGRRFDIVTAFEVFEHVADPVACLDAIDRLLAPDGLLLLSTLVTDGEDGKASIGPRLNWWYAAPRNGHISLHSRHSLTRLLAKAGLNIASANQSFHMGFRDIPKFADHLIKAAPVSG
ncbi:class I SAM-dependent methyltransferase [Hypericibacter sp.]|uniref:class I SAM-dependent methyltransferase n=1 Tax=Hypericibacter sp. TaxID=2705401 RepID=UPI003D6D2BDC